ncbi:MAG: hypothetical protein HKM93_12530, partial [Desulfobacteraceae bacterium]|nr:hypothetical protein [Desulfobacteraceae bacterium]
MITTLLFQKMWGFTLNALHMKASNTCKIQVIKETTTPEGQPPASKYYVWGLDLSQSMQGAGGIGGLIAVIDNGTTHNFCYDANGNVGQLINAATGTITAHYEYQPFGELIHSYGDYAGENGYRF